MERADLGDGELSGLAWLIAHTQTWTEVRFVPEKHSTKVTQENKKKRKIDNNKKLKNNRKHKG